MGIPNQRKDMTKMVKYLILVNVAPIRTRTFPSCPRASRVSLEMQVSGRFEENKSDGYLKESTAPDSDRIRTAVEAWAVMSAATSRMGAAQSQ